MQRVYPVFLDLLIASDLAPRVEEIILGKDRAHLRVHPIGDHAEGMVLHQLGDVSGVAGGELDVGVVDRCLLTDRALELKHHQWNAIDVEDAIGDALLFSHYL